MQGTDVLETFLYGVIGCKTDEDMKEFLSSIFYLPENIHKYFLRNENVAKKEKETEVKQEDLSSSDSDDEKEIINLLTNTRLPVYKNL